MIAAMPTRLSLADPPVLQLGEVPALHYRFEDWQKVVALQRNSMPTALQIEAQIETIENWLMPHLQSLTPAMRSLPLEVEAPSLRAALGANGMQPHVLGIDEIERVFNRVADIASGQPAQAGDPPLGAGAVAGLVLWREVMHHGGFASAVLRARPDDAPS